MSLGSDGVVYHNIHRAHFADEILVRFADNAAPEDTARLKAALGAVTLSTTPLTGIERLQLPAGSDLDMVLRRLNANPLVEMTDLNYQIDAVETGEVFLPDDPLYGIQWGLENTGVIPDFGNPGLQQTMQQIAVADSDIDAGSAWTVSTGAGVIVAVIDTGIDFDHPDLDDNLWFNQDEIAGNGIDDDNNGYIDDINGFDFGGASLGVIGDGDNDLTDLDGHGTHVAGILAAEADNGIGVTGAAFDAEIMALRVGSDDSTLLSGFAILEAIEYAAANGARISNNSYGPLGAFHRSVIEAAGALGHLFIYAAGNDSEDQDLLDPSDTIYDLDNVIAVAATTLDDSLASFSNFGETTVDLAAPGHYIASTYLNGGYAFLSGTSMAAPHVAGAAALALAINPALTVAELVELILSTVDQVDSLDGLVTTGGRLNIANMVASLTSTPPQDGGDDGTDPGDGTDVVDLSGDDTIEGTRGNDTLVGGDGNDHLIGRGGMDTLQGDAGSDSIFGGKGDDLIYGGLDDDHLEGLIGSDTIFGGEGEDFILGGRGRDVIDGGGGADFMSGGGGNDFYFVDHVEDRVQETSTGGVDTVSSTISWQLGETFEHLILQSAQVIDALPSSGDGTVSPQAILYGTGNDRSNQITGSDDQNVLDGLKGADTILGNGGNDTIYGGDGNDFLRGGSGDDLIVAGKGHDDLGGGEGADSFLFSYNNLKTRNTIVDFDLDEDVILLEGETVASMADDGGDTLVTLSSGIEILMTGISAAEIDADTHFIPI
ncbi:S8 family serine peptidase [Rhodobacteraceae bacterium NNCM2]|nr:S8 family serine peptidase [Coraliihabitans acroporae]